MLHEMHLMMGVQGLRVIFFLCPLGVMHVVCTEVERPVLRVLHVVRVLPLLFV